MQPAVAADLREIISHADTRAAALAAIETFSEKYAVKYERGVACLTKNTGAILAFYDFPAERWDHLRTSNPSRASPQPSAIARFGPRALCRRRLQS